LLIVENTGGNVGLAITQAIGLTGMLQWGMRQSAELENQMTSVERILEFTNIEQEPPLTSPQGEIKIIVLSSVLCPLTVLCNTSRSRTRRDFLDK
jgi:hypothetical protein